MPQMETRWIKVVYISSLPPLISSARRQNLATPNYSYEKRQKELAKKRKKEEKLKRKAEKGDSPLPSSDAQTSDQPAPDQQGSQQS